MLSDNDLSTLESLHSQGTSLRALLQLAYCHGRVDELRASLRDIRDAASAGPMASTVDRVTAPGAIVEVDFDA